MSVRLFDWAIAGAPVLHEVFRLFELLRLREGTTRDSCGLACVLVFSDQIGRRRIPQGLQVLSRQIAAENRLWG